MAFRFQFVPFVGATGPRRLDANELMLGAPRAYSLMLQVGF